MPEETTPALNTDPESPAGATNNFDTEQVLAQIQQDIAGDESGTDIQTESESLNATAPQNLETAQATAKAHEESVSYDRFKEINERAKQLQEQLDAVKPLSEWKEAVKQLQEYGYQTPQQLAEQLAQQRQQAEQAAIQQQIAKQVEDHRYNYGDEAAALYQQVLVQNVQTQRLLAETQKQRFYNEIDAKFATIKDVIPADLHEQALALAREANDPATVDKVINTLKLVATTAANNAKVSYATNKNNSATVPAPVTRGGSPAQAGAAQDQRPDAFKTSSYLGLLGIGPR